MPGSYSTLMMKGAFKMKPPYQKHVPTHVAGQYLSDNGDGTYTDVDTKKVYTDTKGIVTSKDGNVVDNDYTVNDKGVITGTYSYPADKKK